MFVMCKKIVYCHNFYKINANCIQRQYVIHRPTYIQEDSATIQLVALPAMAQFVRVGLWGFVTSVVSLFAPCFMSCITVRMDR
jgi:hypothetical protein